MAPTVKVMVELPLPGAAMVPGLKLMLVPAGAPVADSAMELLKRASRGGGNR